LTDGLITDRRAGKPATEVSKALAKTLSANIAIDGVDVFVIPGKEHRFAMVFRGENLVGPLTDADPQREGEKPIPVTPFSPDGEHAAHVVNDAIRQAGEILDHPKANTVLLRGIGNPPDLPSLESLYGIRCAAIATYPMYRGIASLVGMDILPVPSMEHSAEVDVLEANFDNYDFFYLHIKETDSYGHTGEFEKKAGVLEECDPLFQRAFELGFDVVVVTGDHCTPCILREHSWHPIPTALWSKTVLSGHSTGYSERECNRGSYGIRASREILPLALAEAGRLKKFGA
jgi:2,3-bisphosphoglycerate-independent phosphoglycerate mutase